MAAVATALKLRPLYDRIVVRRKEPREQVRGGIIIPDTAKEKPQEAEVIAVGEGKFNDEGKRMKLDVKKGDTVVMRRPVMNGLDAAKILHQIMPQVPLILCSLHADDILRKEATHAGVNAVISKAQNMETLVYKARELLGNHNH